MECTAANPVWNRDGIRWTTLWPGRPDDLSPGCRPLYNQGHKIIGFRVPRIESGNIVLNQPVIKASVIVMPKTVMVMLPSGMCLSAPVFCHPR